MGKFFGWFAVGVISVVSLSSLGCATGATAVSAASIGAPAISQVSPQSIPAGAPTQVIKVVGTNFGDQPVILWNGSVLTTSKLDATTVSGTVDRSVLASPATIQLQVRNTSDGQQSAAVPVTVASDSPASAPDLSISTTSLAAAPFGIAYSQALQASGGTPGYSWTLASGTLPGGLSLTPSGIISGTPTTAGTFTFTVAVSDRGNPVQSKSTALSLVVSSSPSASALAITSTSLPAGSTGVAYGQILQAAGGTPNYVWALTSGALPTGISLSPSGLISGTPTASGTSTFTVTVTDSGSPAQSKSLTTSIVIAPFALAVRSSTLASGSAGIAYSQSLQASGGTPAYSWSITSGVLPTGLSIVPSTGVIAGTPTASGTFPFTATVVDSSSPAQSKSVSTSILIAPSSLAIASGSLTAAVTGTAYSQTLQATGGKPNYTWAVTSGALPIGLTLASSGLISGTPTTSGTFNVTITVTDSGSPAQNKSAAYTIVVSPSSLLTITSSVLASGTKDLAYSQSLRAGGGTSPYIWSITSGTLPSGVTLTPSSGLISGTPTTSGTFTFTATVTDSSRPVQTKSLTTSIVITPASLTITTTTLAAATLSAAYSQPLLAIGGTPSYSWSITAGALPAGITLSTAGLLSGTPTASGNFAFTATVTDASSPGQTKSVRLILPVAGTTLSIFTSSLAAGAIRTTYSQTLQATGGTPTYTWSVTAGSLPAGVTLAASTGVISGIPTASGTANFTVTVTDSSSPALTKSAPLSITVSAAGLTITSSTLSPGVSGTAYAQSLTATGGIPSYAWSYTGTLPPGLSLAATTGVISGTPTATGTSSFTVTVTDSSNPALTRSAATSITISAASAPTGPGTTWYIRPDGGTRYSANVPTGQCDGKADVAYSGTGTNQHCAFSDYRYLWDDQSYKNDAWVISGGDTVIIRGGPWRVGWDANSGPGAGFTWCLGTDNIGCVNPTVPAGTPTQHTRILGENYAACSATNKTEIFGGFGVITALNLSGAQYVDVQCLDITRHSQCITFGSPAYPAGCNSGTPVDDYDSDGVHTDIATHDLLMQDLYIHGHVGRGIKGPIGGVVTCLRCQISYNGAAGWDFDDGNATPFPAGALWNFNYSTIEWSGCNQEYPVVSAIPAISCYSQSTGGYGDGVGTPAGTGLSVSIDHSTFRYNTQDGLDLGHVDTGVFTLNIANSIAYGNSGGTFKWGANFTAVTFLNNVAIGNCLRMSAPIPGVPSTFNAHLSDFCRAQDAVSFNFRQGGTALLANNTVVSYAPTTFDINCWDGSCSNSTLTFKNNIVLGYENPTTYTMGGQVGGPGGLYFQAPIGNVVRSNNIFYGIRSVTCPTGNPAEYCTSPLFVNQPTWTGESSLDNFNFTPTSGSPAKGAGVSLPSVTLDYNGVVRGNPPSIGAVE